MPRATRVPPKKRKTSVVEWNNKMAMTYDHLKVMSVPPERPAEQSFVVVPLPGGQGYYAYHCWCIACLATLVTRWKEFHLDETVVPNKRLTKPVVPFV